MLQISRTELIKHLGKGASQALTDAANLAASQGAYEITIEHFLHCAHALPNSDIGQIFNHFGIRRDRFSDALASCFERQRVGAQTQPTFAALLVELMQEAWLLSNMELSQDKIRTGAMFLAGILNVSKYLRFEYVSTLDDLGAASLREKFAHICSGSIESPISAEGTDPKNQGEEKFEAAYLEKYATNFTALAAEGKIDPVFCRDAEIDQIVDVLSRRRKNNPIAVGEAGVGKTALVEGLALRIAAGDCPEHLQGCGLWGLDLGALQAGASVKGEFEKRLKGVIDEAKSSPTPLILFIDEAHTLIGAGGQAGGSDAANLLKPALARGELKTIAATTWSEYKKYFEKDPALSRRFQLIQLKEPTHEQATTILRGLVPAYEANHEVYIHDSAVRAAAELSDRYISGRQLPDKAIDVLDTACARVRVALSEKPRPLDHVERQIALTQRTLAALRRDALMVGSSAEDAGDLEAELKTLTSRADALRTQWEAERSLVTDLLQARQEILTEDGADPAKIELANRLHADLEATQGDGDGLISYQVDELQVAAVISDWTGVPLGAMKKGEAEKVANLELHLGEVIKGQSTAVAAIANALKGSTAGLTRPDVPRGVFLAVGPSGVGKTETALQIAEVMFGGDQFLTTINLSEYQERHSLSRLIGSPPGYVGYGEGGVLSEAIRRNPYSVVLLDEIEKADPEILNLFYQVFDKGMLSDGEAREIDCKNVIFFLTSNLGSDLIEDHPDLDTPALATLINPVLVQHMKPALVARMNVVPFASLDASAMTEIIELKISRVSDQLRQTHGTQAHWTPAARAAIIQRCTVGQSGARLIDQVIERQILPEAATRLLHYVAQGIQAAHMVVDFGPVSDEDGAAQDFHIQFADEVVVESPPANPVSGDSESSESEESRAAAKTGPSDSPALCDPSLPSDPNLDGSDD